MNLNADEDGFYWSPTPHLKFVNGQLMQWWDGVRELSYGEIAHEAVTTHHKGEWRKVKSE